MFTTWLTYCIWLDQCRPITYPLNCDFNINQIHDFDQTATYKYYILGVIFEEQKNILEGNGLFTENLSSGMITFDKNYADKSLEFIYFYIYE